MKNKKGKNFILLFHVFQSEMICELEFWPKNESKKLNKRNNMRRKKVDSLENQLNPKLYQCTTLKTRKLVSCLFYTEPFSQDDMSNIPKYSC